MPELKSPAIEWVDPFKLDPYQAEGVDFLIANKGGYIALPVGSGKTCIVLKATRQMPFVKTIHVLCRGNSLWTWVRNMRMWRPDLAESMVVIEKMSPSQRLAIWNSNKYKVVIASAKTFQRDYEKINYVPDLVILDECQEYIRNRKSKTSQSIIEFVQAAKAGVFLSGTAVSRGRQEFFGPLSALRPKRFTSYWRFVNQYCHVTKTQFGMVIGPPRNTDQYREATKDVIFRPKNPIIGLPPIVRTTIPIEMTPEQERLYSHLKEDMMHLMDSGELLVTQNTLAQLTRLRQTLVCPAILDSTAGYGSGILSTMDHMEEQGLMHVVWATPFTDAIPFMERALITRFGISNIVIFKSGMTVEELREAEETFRNDSKAVALMSIDYSQSYELETGEAIYFIGYSFRPDQNEQAEGRLRRKTTKSEFVPSFYLQNLGTYDDNQLDILSRKTLNTKVDIYDMHALRHLLTNHQKPIGPEIDSH